MSHTRLERRMMIVMFLCAVNQQFALFSAELRPINMCTWNHSDVYKLNTGIVNCILGVHLSWMEMDIFRVGETGASCNKNNIFQDCGRVS